MTLLDHVVNRLTSRQQDLKMIDGSHHLFDCGKRAAIIQEIHWLEYIIKQIQQNRIVW